MDNSLKEIVWNQFGASIDMLISTIVNCPDDYFETNKRFYYIAFHTTLFLDYYLTIPPTEFTPLLSCNSKPNEDLSKESIGDMIPDKIYAKEEIINYLKKSREKCKNLIFSITEKTINQRFYEGDESNDMDYPIIEILLYNLRHTQHHTGQLNLLLRQDFDRHMNWSFRTGDLQIEE
jgi:hypothetical protein